jgi:DNA polymerase-3 subunit delta
MVAIKPADADAFVAKPNPAQPVILVFGPDAGLVHERAEALIKSAVDDPSDPFMLARLEADDLAGNATRLAEEAQTIPMFGGRRAVWLRAGGRFNIVPAVEALLALPQLECRVVIEAGDLRRGTGLRNLVERAKQAAAIACYADDEKSLPRLIDQEVRAAGLTIAPDARAMLVPLLGGDRQATRSELRKLILYAMGKERIEVDDVASVVANASALAIDSVIDAAFAGRLPEVEAELAKLSVAGTSPGAVIGAAQRQVSELHKLRLAADDGGSITSVVERKQPPIHFRRKPLIEAALKAWSSDRLLRTMDDLATAAFELRRQASLAESIAQRALLSIAMTARRGR